MGYLTHDSVYQVIGNTPRTLAQIVKDLQEKYDIKPRWGFLTLSTLSHLRYLRDLGLVEKVHVDCETNNPFLPIVTIPGYKRKEYGTKFVPRPVEVMQRFRP